MKFHLFLQSVKKLGKSISPISPVSSSKLRDTFQLFSSYPRKVFEYHVITYASFLAQIPRVYFCETSRYAEKRLNRFVQICSLHGLIMLKIDFNICLLCKSIHHRIKQPVNAKRYHQSQRILSLCNKEIFIYLLWIFLLVIIQSIETYGIFTNNNCFL